MVSQRTAEFVAGVLAAAAISGGLSLVVASPYALAVGLAAGTPVLVRTSRRLDRDAYLADHTVGEQAGDAAFTAGVALALGSAAAHVAVSMGYAGSVAAAVTAALGVLGGQAAFYAQNAGYLE